MERLILCVAMLVLAGCEGFQTTELSTALLISSVNSQAASELTDELAKAADGYCLRVPAELRLPIRQQVNAKAEVAQNVQIPCRGDPE